MNNKYINLQEIYESIHHYQVLNHYLGQDVHMYYELDNFTFL
jgi:hypothetical protein